MLKTTAQVKPHLQIANGVRQFRFPLFHKVRAEVGSHRICRHTQLYSEIYSGMTPTLNPEPSLCEEIAVPAFMPSKPPKVGVLFISSSKIVFCHKGLWSDIIIDIPRVKLVSRHLIDQGE